VTTGLTGSAIQGKSTVVVGDVRSDPRYLTAFGSTLSEIIIPILDPRDSRVVGTIDVESERANAFSAADQETLEQCANAALALWVDA
jgi:L-methionine (R)-S-oxide reductase